MSASRKNCGVCEDFRSSFRFVLFLLSRRRCVFTRHQLLPGTSRVVIIISNFIISISKRTIFFKIDTNILHRQYLQPANSIPTNSLSILPSIKLRSQSTLFCRRFSGELLELRLQFVLFPLPSLLGIDCNCYTQSRTRRRIFLKYYTQKESYSVLLAERGCKHDL